MLSMYSALFSCSGHGLGHIDLGRVPNTQIERHNPSGPMVLF